MAPTTATVTVADTAATPDTATGHLIAHARTAWETALDALNQISAIETVRYVQLEVARRRFDVAHTEWQDAKQAEDAAGSAVMVAQEELVDVIAAAHPHDGDRGRGGPVHISEALADLRHQLMGGRP